MALSPFALPNVADVDPQQGAPFNLNHTYVFPKACQLKAAHAHGKAATIATSNTLAVGGVPQATDLEIWINGAFAKKLLTIPAATNDFDEFFAGAVDIPKDAEVAFVLEVDGNASGVLQNVLFAFAVNG